MKLLFDQNLSHKLPLQLADLFPDSLHVSTASLDRASDSLIWNYARDQGFVVVTKDSDFADRSKLFGSPPSVVWLRCGNATPAHISQLLRRSAAMIEELAKTGTGPVLEIF